MPEDNGKKSPKAPKVAPKATETKPNDDFAIKLVKDKSEIPKNAVLMTDTDGSQYYQLVTKGKGEEKKDTPRKPTPTTGIRVPSKSKPKPPTDDSSGWHGETIQKWKIEPTVSKPKDEKTGLYGGAMVAENIDPAKQWGLNYGITTVTFPDKDGHMASGGRNINFDKEGREVVYDKSNPLNSFKDGKFTPTYTGKTKQDYQREFGLTGYTNPTNDGVTKANPDYKGSLLMPGTEASFGTSAGGMLDRHNSSGIKGKVITPSGFIAPKYDSLGKLIVTPNTGVQYDKVNTIPLEKDNMEVGKMYDIPKKVGQMRPMVTSAKFAKGGVVGSIKGYFDGGITYDPNKNIDGTYGDANSSNRPLTQTGNYDDVDSGVVGMNDQYSTAKKEEVKKTKTEQQLKNEANARAVANGLGTALGGYGAAHYNSTPTSTKEEATRGAAMTAVSGAGPIGGAIGGLAAIGDKIGAPKKLKYEAMDSEGNLLDANRSKRNAIGGGLMSPSKALAYRSESGNWGDVSGNKYNEFIEGKAKKQIAEVKAANVASQQQQAIAARDAGNFNPTMTNPYDLSGATFGKDQQLILSGNQQFDKNRPYAKGGIVQSLQDGGVIKGKGTGKSDSIHAKVEGGSFVVPAENAKVAEELRAKLLKSPPKTKANLNQSNGEQVKLSNNEHLFTPEEKQELLDRGVDVNMLAPNADKKEVKKEYVQFPNILGYAKGGPVDGVDPKKESARIDAEAKKAAEDKIKAVNDATEKERVYQLKRRRESQIKEQQSDLLKYTKLISDTEKEYNDFKNGRKDSDDKGYKSENDKTAQGLLATLQDYKNKQLNASRTRKFVNDDNNYNTDGSIKEVKSTQNDLSKVEASKDLEFKPKGKQSDKTYDELVRKPNHFKGTDADWKKAVDASIAKGDTIPKAGTVTKPTVRVPGGGVKSTAKNTYTTPQVVDNGAADEAIVPTAPAVQTSAEKQAAADAKALSDSATATGITPDNMGKNGLASNKSGWASKIGNIDPTAFLGIGQAALGLNMLKGQKRPIDNAVIDPTYNANVNRSMEDAKFGLTAEQQFAANQEIQNGLNDAKFQGLNYSGGNGVQAFNTNRAAINDAWKARLGLKEADTNLRMKKQQYADSQVADRAGILANNRRMLFNDTMNAFQQNQQAGSELIGAGLANTIGAYRFNQEMKSQREAENASTDWERRFGTGV